MTSSALAPDERHPRGSNHPDVSRDVGSGESSHGLFRFRLRVWRICRRNPMEEVRSRRIDPIESAENRFSGLALARSATSA